MTGLPPKVTLAGATPAIRKTAGFGPADVTRKQIGRVRSASGRFASQKPSIELLTPWREPDAPASSPESLPPRSPATAKPPATAGSLVGAPRVTRPLPRFMKSALASLMVACGDLECAMEAAAYRAIGIEPHHARLVTEPGLGPKIRILKTLVAEKNFGEDFRDAETRIWPAADAVEAAWTVIAHQRLFMLDQSKLLAGELPEDGAEPEDRIYPLQRLYRLETIALSLAEIFRQAAQRFETAGSSR